MLTRRGVAIVRHLLPEPTGIDLEEAADALADRLPRFADYVEHTKSGLLIPRWPAQVGIFSFDGLFSRDVQ